MHMRAKTAPHSFTPISPQTDWPAAKGGISPGSFENVGQGTLVSVQRCPLVPVFVNNRANG
jgi:hypothetical protein